VGHAFTTDVLLEEQGSALEQALWVAFRTLKERSDLVRTLAESAEHRGFNASAARYRDVIEDLEEHSDVIKHVLSGTKHVLDEIE
jgi:two-component system chemotaxis response regulator CheB